MMNYFVQDLENNIGLITSARNLIDENGNIIGQCNPWQPLNDEVLSGNVLGKNIIFSQQYYIGEMSTVLLRKSLLKQNNGEFLTGYFCGFRDKANGDVASFLDIAR